MPPSPVPADPGRDEDLAWLDRDPMTAGEFEASLDRLCELDEGYREDEDEDVEPFTAEELAGIREAAADELLSVTAATTGRRGCSPASRPARRPGSARGWSWTCCRAAPGWRYRPTPPPAMAVSIACTRLSWSGWCARGTGSRPTRTPASSPRSPSWPGGTPGSWTRSSPRTRTRTRWGSPGPGPTA